MQTALVSLTGSLHYVALPTSACMHRYWDSGIVEVIKDMFKGSKFRDQYHQPCKYEDPTSYFAKAAFRAYDSTANGRVSKDKPDHVFPSCMLQLGGDGVSLLNFGQRTATVIGVRCEELCGEFSQSNLAWRPVIIIEGPKETMVLHNIMKATIDKLRRHAPMKNVGVYLGQVSLHLLCTSSPFLSCD